MPTLTGNIYHTNNGNYPAYRRISGSYFAEDARVGAYDPTKSGFAFHCTPSSPHAIDIATPKTAIWFHAYLYLSKNSGTDDILVFSDTAGLPIIRILNSAIDGQWKIQKNTTGGYTDLMTVTKNISGNKGFDFDIEIILGTSGSVKVWIDQGVAGAFSGNTLSDNTDATGIKSVEFRGSHAEGIWSSQTIIGDNFNPGRYVQTWGLATNTSQADFAGTVTDISPLSSPSSGTKYYTTDGGAEDNTFISAATAGSKSVFGLESTIPLDTTTYSIDAVVVTNNYKFALGTALTQYQNILENAGGTQHLGTAVTGVIDGNYRTRSEVFTTNPFTANEWTKADIENGALKIGITVG